MAPAPLIMAAPQPTISPTTLTPVSATPSHNHTNTKQDGHQHAHGTGHEALHSYFTGVVILAILLFIVGLVACSLRIKEVRHDRMNRSKRGVAAIGMMLGETPQKPSRNVRDLDTNVGVVSPGLEWTSLSSSNIGPPRYEHAENSDSGYESGSSRGIVPWSTSAI